ncbi:MAG: type II toxin-antitoxin system RelE/ParE family toxin [Gemmatimonadetes bacterium]|nr:type II toxin-antitoxin system RelE/ParE family toxin [Gemmatimonadota bacterium]
MTYGITFLPQADRQFRALSRATQARIKPRIDSLADNPRPRQAKPLHGSLKGRWRPRVGDYRVIYEIRDDVLIVLVISVGARSGVYGETARRG